MTETIKNIKVTATYEKAIPTRLKNAIKECEMAIHLKEVAEAEIPPIINAIGEKKVELILKQCEPLFEAMDYLNEINRGLTVIKTFVRDVAIVLYPTSLVCKKINRLKVETSYCPHYVPLDSEYLLKDKESIIANWEEWEVYKLLEDRVIYFLQNETKAAQNSTEYLKATLNSFVNHN